MYETYQPGKLMFTVQFEEANGLQQGDLLYIMGLKIGSVRQVNQDIAHHAIVAQVLLDSKHTIPDDSFFFIWSDDQPARHSTRGSHLRREFNPRHYRPSP